MSSLDAEYTGKNLEIKSGLYIISTPIGNKRDITLRALELLEQLDYIYSEDPSKSVKLLNLHNIKRSIRKYNDQAGDNLRTNIAAEIESGKSVGIISDAGTPLISDPGYKLVHLLNQRKLPVFPVPGCCAAIAALSCAGLPSDRFTFVGFAPRKETQLENFFADLKKYQGSLIFYESSQRIINFCQVAAKYFIGCEIFIARELTKLYEDKISAKIEDIEEILSQHDNLKGEFVIIINNDNMGKDVTFENDLDRILQLGKKYLSLKDLSKFLSEVTNLSKKEIYNQGINGK